MTIANSLMVAHGRLRDGEFDVVGRSAALAKIISTR